MSLFFFQKSTALIWTKFVLHRFSVVYMYITQPVLKHRVKYVGKLIKGTFPNISRWLLNRVTDQLAAKLALFKQL